MIDTVIHGDVSIYNQLTNVGAWFSSDMTSSSYILIEDGIDAPQIVMVLCFRSENYNKALRLLCEQFSEYGSITIVNYDHDLDRFEFELLDNDNQEPHYFYLESIDKYLKEV